MAETTERLLLQVDAATELLRRHLGEAEQPLDRFERRADKMAENVDRSIGEMGGRFGAFASLADDAAKRAQKSFEASFSQVQRIASQAIKGPTIDARVNLGVGDLRAQAAAAQDQAKSFALIGAAAERASGGTRTASEATYLFIQATNASRIEAEQKATALLAEAGALERVQIELMQSAEATEHFVTKHQRIAEAAAQERLLAIATADAATEQRALAASADLVRASIDPMYAAQQRFDQEMTRAEKLLDAGIFGQREYEQAVTQSRNALYEHAQAITGTAPAGRQLVQNTGAQRAAMQGLSFQAQDTFTQLSMGANAFSVIAIQGGQAAGQFANLEGKVGSFARYMIGPYGLAITAALLVTGALTEDLHLFSDEVEDAIDKLKKDARETELTEKAKARFGSTLEGVSAAIRDQAKALKESAASETDATERANIDANTRARQAAEIRKVTASRLADAIAAREALDDSAFANTDPRAAAVAKRVRDDQVAGLRTQLAGADAAAALADQNVNRTLVDLAAANAKRAIDPLAQINRLYDQQALAVRRAARSAVAAGATVTAGLTRQLIAIERNRKAALQAEQDRQSATRSSSTANRQFGRQVDVAGATAIVASIGGRVTSGQRSTQRQAELYAAAQNGTHIGPVAKPGTSAHERGQAVDVAYGPGITVAAIKKAFADAGVSLRKVLDEPTQRVFHVEYGKAGRAGPSAATLAKREEAARIKVLRDDSEFANDVLQARRRLIDATARSAGSEEQRDQLLRDEINGEADTTKRKLANAVQAGELTAAQGQQLDGINEATRQQRLQNVKIEAATRLIDRQYQTRADDAQSRTEILRLQQGMAVTDADREKIGREILALEQQLRRATLERLRDTSPDADQVQGAKDALGRLPALEKAETDSFDAGNAGPIEQYRQRLVAATDDMDSALQGVAVRGFGSLEDAGSRQIASILKLKGAYGELASSVISDLARIAIQKAALSVLSGGSLFAGFSDGGEIPGFAGGGSPGGLITGPGTGKSDSILALLSNGNRPIRISAGEFIMNEEATRANLPALQAMNAGRGLPRFATGGIAGLRAPRMPALSASSGGNRISMPVAIDARGAGDPAAVEAAAFRAVAAAVPLIVEASKGGTMIHLTRPSLPATAG